MSKTDNREISTRTRCDIIILTVHTNPNHTLI